MKKEREEGRGHERKDKRLNKMELEKGVREDLTSGKQERVGSVRFLSSQKGTIIVIDEVSTIQECSLGSGQGQVSNKDKNS